MAPAARRAAAAAGRYLAATARSAAAAPPRAAVIHHAGPRAAAIHHAGPRAAATARSAAAAPPRAAVIDHAGPRAAATARSAAVAPPRAAVIHQAGPRAAAPHLSAVAIHQASPSPCAVAIHQAPPPPSAVAIHQRTLSPVAMNCVSSSSANTRSITSNLTKCRFGPRSRPFKIQRRLTHSQTRKIPEEVKSELQRIDAEGLQRHKDLQESLRMLTKKVAEQKANAKVYKSVGTWQMGKSAWVVCCTVLATAACSGYVIIKSIKFGSGNNSQTKVGSLIDSKIGELKKELETKMYGILEKDKEELEEKSVLLDQKEAELQKREHAVAAKEALAKQD